MATKGIAILVIALPAFCGLERADCNYIEAGELSGAKPVQSRATHGPGGSSITVTTTYVKGSWLRIG
ncbi:MAG TPA: hypothetical protein VEN79_06080 [Terriglobia bacterium]|nr:hypothetical protein [Terriglobia bacterium]